jgi:hypothetical protein
MENDNDWVVDLAENNNRYIKRINELAAANYENETYPLPAVFGVMDYNIYVLLISQSQKVPRI